MKKQSAKFLLIIVFLAIATSSYGLTILPTFDSSITNDPNAPAIMAAITAAIQVFHTNFSDNLTVKINFKSDSNVGLGQSLTWGSEYAYSNYLSALRSQATDANDTNALSKLTNSSVEPVTGGPQVHLSSALARQMGLRSTYGPDGFDSDISLNMTLMNFTRPPTNSDNYDLQAVAEHEMDEVLGSPSGLPSSSFIWAADLFRYDTNLNRTWTNSGDNAYFSPDGTNLVARYNQQTDGSDYGDWWGGAQGGTYWSPPGISPHSQVQDAYGTQGAYEDLGVAELTLLDVIGYTLALTNKTIATRPALAIVRSGAGQITLSWPQNVTDFTLLERTNLGLGNWVASPSGTTNPAVIAAGGAIKFYELVQQPFVLSEKLPGNVGNKALTTDKREVHVFQPRPQP